MKKTMEVKTIVAIVFAVLAVIISVVSMAIPYWTCGEGIFTMVGRARYSQGLWKACMPVLGRHLCANVAATSAIQATRAMMIIGFLCTVAALGCFIIRACVMKNKMGLQKLATALAIIAGIVMLIGAIVYGASYSRNLYAGFGLAIVAAVFVIISAVFMCLTPNEVYTTK